MPTQAIPTCTELSEVYTPESLVHQGQRWNGLLEAFEKEYGTEARKAAKVSRAPGRVNIIGSSSSPSLTRGGEWGAESQRWALEERASVQRRRDLTDLCSLNRRAHRLLWLFRPPFRR